MHTYINVHEESKVRLHKRAAARQLVYNFHNNQNGDLYYNHFTFADLRLYL